MCSRGSLPRHVIKIKQAFLSELLRGRHALSIQTLLFFPLNFPKAWGNLWIIVFFQLAFHQYFIIFWPYRLPVFSTIRIILLILRLYKERLSEGVWKKITVKIQITMLMIIFKLHIHDTIFFKTVGSYLLANQDWSRQTLAGEFLRLFRGGKLTEEMPTCLVPVGGSDWSEEPY